MRTMDTAIILAGGKSSRMGFDKQFLRVNERLVIDILLEKLQGIFNEMIVVTNKPQVYGKYSVITVQDQLPNWGPLGGIHAGLKASHSAYNYVIACDMPLINVAYIKHMQDIILDAPGVVDAIVTRLGNWIEPFNAFYSVDLVTNIEEAHRNGIRKISTVLRGANVIYIDELEARQYSPNWEMFTNLNTTQDILKFQV